MGARGKPPQPRAMLERRGSKQLYKRGKEPVIAPGTPACPDWLQGYAKDRWNYIVPLLAGAGILSQVDQDALAQHCDTMGHWWNARDKGKLTHREYLAFMATLGRQQQQFGLTSSARARLAAPPDKKPAKGKERFFEPRIAG